MAQSVVEGSVRETGWSDVTLPGFITAMFMFVILLCTLWFLLASFWLPLSVHSSAGTVFSHCPFVIVISYFLLCGLTMVRLSGAVRALTLLICDSDCLIYLDQ